MSTKWSCIRSLRAVSRDHRGIAAVVLATIGLAPFVAAGEDARTASGLLASVDKGRIVVHRSGEPDLRLTVDGGTRVALDGGRASVSDLRRGQEVRASYEEADGVPKATRIEARREQGQPLRTMSPDDPEWDLVHSGG